MKSLIQLVAIVVALLFTGTSGFSFQALPRSSSRTQITRLLLLHEHDTTTSSESDVSIEVQGATTETTATATANPQETNDSDIDIGTDIEIDALTTLAGNIVQCLIQSDLKRQGGGDGGGSTGWTSWVDDKTAFSLQCCIDSLALSKPINPSDTNGLKQDLLLERDEALGWMRWMKATPSPVFIELSHQLRDIASGLVGDRDLEMIDSTREEFLERE